MVTPVPYQCVVVDAPLHSAYLSSLENNPIGIPYCLNLYVVLFLLFGWFCAFHCSQTSVLPSSLPVRVGDVLFFSHIGARSSFVLSSSLVVCIFLFFICGGRSQFKSQSVNGTFLVEKLNSHFQHRQHTRPHHNLNVFFLLLCNFWLFIIFSPWFPYQIPTIRL